MTQPPFTVSVRVDLGTRGVFKARPLAAGAVHVAGRSVEVELLVQEGEVTPEHPEPVGPLKLVVQYADHDGKRALLIDATDLLEAVVGEAMAGPKGPRLVD